MKKAIIWGHKYTTPMGSHTHSFIHQGFYNAFKHLGFETYWFNNSDSPNPDLFSNAIYLTEGQVDQNIPLRKDSKYILHNCDYSRYNSIIDNCIKLWGPSTDAFRLTENLETIDQESLTFFAPKNQTESIRTIITPWATNLLPDEFPDIDVNYIRNNRDKTVYFVGTAYGDNYQVLNELYAACQKHGIKFGMGRVPEGPQHVQVVQKSWISLDLRHQGHVDCGYIPCRMFKNISYGRLTGTNSKAVFDLFSQKIPYSTNVEQLFLQLQEEEMSLTQSRLDELRNVVKSKHTYVNRIQNILKVI